MDGGASLACICVLFFVPGGVGVGSCGMDGVSVV